MKTKIDYESQAARFLMETGGSIQVKYDDHGLYFDDDKNLVTFTASCCEGTENRSPSGLGSPLPALV